MTQRPVVSMIVERVEVPVGFRTKGPDNRLIIVEGVGDMVLRNGKRIICIKMRRSDDSGLEYAIDSRDYMPPSWEVGPTIPNQQTMGYGSSAGFSANNQSGSMMPTAQTDIQVGQSQIIVPEYSKGSYQYGGNVADNFDYSKMQRISNPGRSSLAGGSMFPYSYGKGFEDTTDSNISIELGADGDVANLEDLWSKLSSKYSEQLSGFTPFFSVDAPADGQGKELFHLRVGPVKNLDEGDKICGELGRNGVFCSVVRTQ